VVRLHIIRLEMTILERVRVTSIVEKIVETSLRCFRHVESKHVDFVVRRVNQIESRKDTRDRGRSIKIIRELLRKIYRLMN
jgi:phage terminase Nu1 subunit (DNA packaging protein)